MAQKKKRANIYLKAPDTAVISKIKSILEQRPSYGYRRISALLKADQKKNKEMPWNHKKVYRMMKLENLLLTRPEHRQKKAHDGKVETLFSNTRWCSDSFSIQCQNGERVHVAFSLDTCDREAMCYIASTIGIDGQAIRDLMLETLEYRLRTTRSEKPIQWLTDNGSCYTAKDTVAFCKRLGFDMRTTLPYSPESNGMAEAFVKTFKRDYVCFGNLKDAKAVVPQLPMWFNDYNEKAPHKGLKMLSPREFLEEPKRVS